VKRLARYNGHVCLRVRQESEERLARRRLALDELFRPVGDLAVDLRSELRIVDLDLSRLRTLPAFIDVFRHGVRAQALLDDRVELRLIGPETLIR
jgi:hypothetical protein